MHAPKFESAAYEFEGKLREIRRLVAETPVASTEQEDLIIVLTKLLRVGNSITAQLRSELFGMGNLPTTTPEFLTELRAELITLGSLDSETQ
jgi:hypothetical protein